MTDDALTFSMNLARKTGELLRDFFRVDGVQADIKSDHSLVTQADLEADALIMNAIQGAYPDDGILTEETNTRYPPRNGYVWVVDPLDGTTNFSLGLHYWGVSIARFKEGQPQTSAVYFPIIDELYAAQQGQGVTLNGKGHQIPQPDDQSPGSFFAHCSRTCHRYQVTIPYKRRSLGAAAYHLCTVAKGSAVIALETTPKLWDIAGAWLVVQEAGGEITTLAGGEPFPAHPGADYQNQPFTTLAAANPSLLEQAKHGLIPKATTIQ